MRKKTISKKQLQLDYNSMNTKELLKKYGVCIQTFYNLLDQAEIPRKRPGFKRGENFKIKMVD